MHAHPQPSPVSPQPGVLGIALALTGHHGGQTGGQRALPPILQSDSFPVVVYATLSSLHAMHGTEQMDNNM